MPWRHRTLAAIILIAGFCLSASGALAEVLNHLGAVASFVSSGENTRPAAVVVYCTPPGVVLTGSGVTTTGGCQTTAGDQTLVPGPPTVSGVTVLVGGGSGNRPGSGTVHGSKGFSITHWTVNRHGVIVLALSAGSAGAFTASASFKTIDVRHTHRPHPHGDYGSGAATLVRRGGVKLSIFPTASAARALSTRAHLAVSITITFKPGMGSGRTATTTLTLS